MDGVPNFLFSPCLKFIPVHHEVPKMIGGIVFKKMNLTHRLFARFPDCFRGTLRCRRPWHDDMQKVILERNVIFRWCSSISVITRPSSSVTDLYSAGLFGGSSTYTYCPNVSSHRFTFHSLIFRGTERCSFFNSSVYWSFSEYFRQAQPINDRLCRKRFWDRPIRLRYEAAAVTVNAKHEVSNP